MRVLLLLFFFFGAAHSFGQQYNFKNYTVQNGLAQSQINSINQDFDGYLWIGTESGLSRFDGINFVNFSIDDGLPDNKIEAIYVSAENEIWVATPKGLAIFKKNKFEAFLFKEQRRVNDIIKFQSVMYLATNEGLIKFENEKYTLMPFDGEEELYIRTLENLDDDILFCGTKTGIYIWTDHYEKLSHPELHDLSVSGLKMRDNHLIISTYRDGLLSYDFDSETVFDFEVEISRIRSLYVDDEVILCSTINGAIEIKDGETIYFSEDNGLANERLICAFRDQENNYWFGSDGIGLLKFLGKALISYTVKDGLSSNLVMNINQDLEGNFLFGTYGEGLNIKDAEDNFQYLTGRDGLPHNSVWSSLVDEEGNYWVATSSGIACFKHGKLVNQEVTSKIESKIRSIIHFDSSFAFAGSSGIHLYNNSELQYLDQTADLNINDICYDNNTIYVASGSGLYCLSEDNGFNDPVKIDLPEESINSVQYDLKKNLWIGTNNGLFVKLADGNIVPIILDAEDFKS
ncbi:MAG: ligand-binding sensor domain-containing protein, partial [Arenicella sp.]